jgi:signal transduction histidine kinase
MAVLMLVVAVLILIISGILSTDTQAGTLQRGMMALPVVGILIFLTVIAVGFLVPPVALASYFAARKTANRLESLTHGTSGLRHGNYSIRVHVDGEDEISTVQHDFNLMAGNLEETIDELRAERDNVEHLLQTQRELVANVSHELRTPVATMRGYLESALDGGQDHSAVNLRDDLQIMAGEVVRLQRLIDDLFVLTRTEAGNLPLSIEPTDVARVVSTSVVAVAEQAWRTGRVEVIEDIKPGIPLALADAGRLEQVIRNLLSNAVRHTPPGGIVAVGVRAQDASLVIDVKDTGEGIPAEHLERIFDRFQRLDNARERDPSGAGLGLAIVLELTQAMGGQVSVTSEPGSGSCFTITLPMAHDS